MRIQLNTQALDALASDLESAPEAVERGVYRGINRVASKAFTRSRREIASQVNLSPAYIRDRMALTQAGPGRLVAVISARRRATRLATFGARQLTRKAARGRKGDALRGIAAGRKQAGISVGVKRGGRKRMPGAFFVPLRAGKEGGGNGMGVFIRTGKGRAAIKHLYGPSVDQVFRGVMDDIAPDIASELQDVVGVQVEYELGRILRK